ncbi:MAG: hypothetical protein RQ899_12105 [Pseudomonadales bacterium]|nr:hypothetical protein [Pseudomonadales bacterium]
MPARIVMNAARADENPDAAIARVQMDSVTLARLIGRRQVSLSEMKSLDAPTKHLLWEICLDTCLESAGKP